MPLACRAGKTVRQEVRPANPWRLVHDRAESEMDIARLEKPSVAAPRARYDLEGNTGRLSGCRVEERRHEQRREEIGRGDHETSGRGRRIERGSTCEEPLGVHE